MSFLEIANNPFVYLVCGIALLVVIGICIVFMTLAWRRAKEIGYTDKRLLGVVRTTLAVSIGPALSILIPLLVVIRVLGSPWGWLRLSVVGSAPMEMAVANLALGFGGFSELGTDLPGSAFGLVAVVVSVSISSGILLNLFFNKSVSTGYDKIQKANPVFASTLTAVLFGSFMAAPAASSAAASTVSLVVLVSSFALFALIMVIAKKWKLKFLSEYSFAIGLLLSMALAIVWNGLLG